MDQAFWYVVDNGITTADLYNYTSKTSKCYYKGTMRQFFIKECAYVKADSYKKLLESVSEQPTAVAVDSSMFRFYNDGVYDRACDTDLNRGVDSELFRCWL